MTFESTYEAVYELYDMDDAWEELVSGGAETVLNIAEEALGRHRDVGEVGLRLKDFTTGDSEQYTFAELAGAAGGVANYLDAHVSDRARIGAMLPAQLELYAVVFGTIGAGRVYVPLAPVFGPEALQYRLGDAGAELLFTTPDHLDKLDRGALPNLETVVVVGDTDRDAIDGITIDPYSMIRDQPAAFETVDTHPRDIFSITYTSGTTGQPKGCPSRHRATLERVHPYLEFAVDLRSTDHYFVAASPAWSYGLVAGTLCAGLRGTAIGCYRGPFDPEQFIETIDEFNVTNLMAPPTALRQLRASPVEPGNYEVDLRVLMSAGESLDAETVEWCHHHLGAQPQDAYGLTEGGMAVCNYPFDEWEIKPGSMGKPAPGFDVALINDDDEMVVCPDEVGEIVIKRRADAGGEYWGNPEESIEMFSGQWLHTGDLASRDDDGYYWYHSRADDVIISAGYRIGPEEVEATLLTHPAVSEAGVIGIPDETRGERVKAYVSLVESTTPSDETAAELISYARETLSKHEYPREIEFVDELPKTASGKIQRAALRSD